MKGGTLLISREIKNHTHIKKRLVELGFNAPTVTGLDRDALNSEIYAMKPDLLIMGARFHHGCTPFMMGELKRNFPKIKMASFVIGEYPPELAMYFILNGIQSYVTTFDGLDEWYKGLAEVSKGREYISEEVMRCIEKRRDLPDPARITKRHTEIIRLFCNGWKELEIAETLHISRNTVVNHRTDILTALNCRSVIELIHVALITKIISLDELCFRHRDIILNPLPKEKIKRRKKD